MRLGLAQQDFSVGALEQNVTKIGAAVSPGTAADADFIVFSEMV
jgi:predicted amidohydrolase